MKYAISILLVIFISASCEQNSKNNLEKNYNTIEENHEVDSNKKKLNKNEEPKSRGVFDFKEEETKKKNIQERRNKIQQERQRLIDATKQIIIRNEATPFFRVDSLTKNREQTHTKLSCKDKLKYSNKNDFSIQFNDEYVNSSNLTQLTDGKMFCLRELDFPGINMAKLVYKRNEGGSSSDAVFIVTVDEESNKVYTLPLSYTTGWEGHEIIVESKIEEEIVIRKITERYGWSNLHPDSLAQQPRREVIQSIKIYNNGSMKVLSEEIDKYNIDELFR